jgi:hypothetical protein
MSSSRELLERITQLEAKVQFLEEQNRYTLDLLDIASSLGDFQTTVSRMQEPSVILEVTAQRANRLLPLTCQAFYLVDESSSDFTLAYYIPRDDRETIDEDINFFIDKGIFTWALKERRPVFITSNDGQRRYLLHAVSTSSRVRGMFVGGLSGNQHEIVDINLALLSNLLLHAANALESYELYSWIHQINRELESKVKALTVSEQELKKHRYRLEDLVNERTGELNTAVRQFQHVLGEKEDLVRQVRTRIRAGLNLAEELSDIQAANPRKNGAHNLYEDFRNRVVAISAAYEHADRLDGELLVPLGPYLEHLAGLGDRPREAGVPKVSLETGDAVLELETAVSCGLAFNEMRTLIMDGRDAGRHTLAVRLEPADSGTRFELAVSPAPSGFDPEASGILERLAARVDGVLDIKAHDDLLVSLTFPA